MKSYPHWLTQGCKKNKKKKRQPLVSLLFSFLFSFVLFLRKSFISRKRLDKEDRIVEKGGAGEDSHHNLILAIGQLQIRSRDPTRSERRQLATCIYRI